MLADSSSAAPMKPWLLTLRPVVIHMTEAESDPCLARLEGKPAQDYCRWARQIPQDGSLVCTHSHLIGFIQRQWRLKLGSHWANIALLVVLLPRANQVKELQQRQSKEASFANRCEGLFWSHLRRKVRV